MSIVSHEEIFSINGGHSVLLSTELGGLEMDRVAESSSSSSAQGLPLLSLNHVSFLCKSLPKSVAFYEQILGFVLIKRPASFDFEGAWLFNYGIGIHLLESERAPESGGVINPKDNHISFQCSDMELVMQKLDDLGVDYVTALVEDGGIQVDQLFFHDPDGYMVEICNCQNLPVLPLSACPLKPPITNAPLSRPPPDYYGKQAGKSMCSGEAAAALMVEMLMVDMMNISI